MVLSVIKLTMFNFLDLEGHLNRFIGSKVSTILVKGGFYLGVDLHQEGSAPAACAAGLLLTLSPRYLFSFFTSTYV